MTKTFTSLLIVCAFLNLNMATAQSDTETKTLFSGDNGINFQDLSFIINPGLSLTTMDDDQALIFHLRAGIGYKNWTLGGFYDVSLNNIVPTSETINSIYMDYWTTGMLIEYTAFSDRLLHLTFPLRVGGGEVQMDSESQEILLGEEHFFLIEPGALLELNLHPHLRLNAGATYRLMSNFNYRNLNASDIDGLTLNAALKVLLFKKQ